MDVKFIEELDEYLLIHEPGVVTLNGAIGAVSATGTLTVKGRQKNAKQAPKAKVVLLETTPRKESSI